MTERPSIPDYRTIFEQALERERAKEIVAAEQRINGIWKLDWKAISILGTLVVGLGTNAFLVGGWVTGVNSRQAADEQAVAALKLATEAAETALKSRIDRIDEARSVGLQRLAAVEQVAKDIAIDLSLINTKLDRLTDKRAGP